MVVNRATIEVTLDCEQSLIFVHSWWNFSFTVGGIRTLKLKEDKENTKLLIRIKQLHIFLKLIRLTILLASFACNVFF